jgi:hypothetical protein
MKRILASLAGLLLSASVAFAGGSTINPAVPAQGAPVQSAPIRNNFAAAATDINNILSMFAGSTQPPSPVTFSFWANPAVNPAPVQIYDGTQYVVMGYLDRTAHTFNLASPCAVCAVVNATNTFTAAQIVNLNAAPLAAGLTGTVLHVGGVDTAITRVQADAFGAVAEFTGAAYGGTNASRTAITSGTALVRINAYAYNGAALVGSIASLEFSAAENIASGHQGSTACLRTTPTASTTLTTGLCQEASGGIIIGSPTGGDKGVGTLNATALYVGGVAVIGGGITTLTNGTTPTSGYTAGQILGSGVGNVLGAYTVNGSGNVLLTSGGVSPSFVTPTLGVATATSVNGLTITSTTGTLTIASSKVLTVNNSLSFIGTDATTMTFPTTTATLARTDAGQTFTGTNAFGVLTGASLALNGASIGSNVLAVNGATTLSGLTTVASALSNALAVGPNGTTNPAFQVDASTVSQAAGVKITGAATGQTVTIAAIDSGPNASITISAKGTGVVNIGSATNSDVQIATALLLGVSTLTNGQIVFENTTSGTITINPPTGALGSAVLTLPDVTDTLTANAATQTLSNKTLNSPTLVTPAIGAATGTSLALGGCTIGASAFCTTGVAVVGGQLGAGTVNANAFFVGPTFASAANAAFIVDTSTASQAAGVKVVGAVTGGTVAIVAIDSGLNTNLAINAKGTGTIFIGGGSSGAIILETSAIFGVSGSIAGSATFNNLTSGSILIQPPTGALGAAVLTLPDVTDTFAVLAAAQAFTNKTITASTNVVGGVTMTLGSDATGDVYYRSAGGLLTRLALGGNGTILQVSGGLPSWQAVSGTGTVTSVGFTGGLITVATATTTPALTVAGTSGGVVYFSSASTWASSALLAANAIMIGGGSGAAPSTTTTGSGVLTAIGNAISANGGLTTTVASGSTAMGTGAIGSGACATVVTATATNTTTTDAMEVAFNADPTAVTGYVPSVSGMLSIIYYPTANTANFKVCNNTGASITPGAVTINWRVLR